MQNSEELKSSLSEQQSPMLTEGERRQILIDWNQTATDYPKDQCVHELFEAQVNKTPDAIALVFEGQQLNYTELNRRANQLAHYLQSLGVGPEVLVGICIERSLEMVVALLGILKAGGAYLPLDPAYPKERLTFMLEDGNVPVLITQQKLEATLPRHRAKCVILESLAADLQKYPDINPEPKVKPDNLAYVIYTSGSTGRPKGVMIPHRGVVRLVSNTNYADFNATQTFLQFAPVSFDASTFEIWGALLNGARLVVFPPYTPSLDELADVLTRNKITTLLLTSGLFHLMVDHHLEVLTKLRQLLAGGDVLSVSHVRKFLTAASDCRLINGYGPTENTTFTCCHTITLESIVSSVPIGRPIANTLVYVLDLNLNPVPVGVPGELHTGGAGLARGYLNRPELTAEKFIHNPFSDDSSARLYKTGDLARYLPDGNIEFLGRIDHQVKIRGFRIELGEIETVLNQHPKVREAVLLARQDQREDKRLVAYVVPHQADIPSIAELRSYLDGKLPNYMIPAAFVILDTMPLTPNGKLDRKALPAPTNIRPEMEQDFVAPQTPLEQSLASIYSEILGLEQIGIHDNFLHLGGHSLLAGQIVARARATLQIELPMRLLISGASVAELAKYIKESKLEGLTTEVIIPVERDGDLPVSFSQERAWFIQQLDTMSIAYHFQAMLRFTGKLDRTALEQALNEIVRRHEILRTTFPTVNGRPVQLIHPAVPIDVLLVDVSMLAVGEREGEAQQFINAELQQRFDLTQLPLVRWVLLRLDTQEHILLQIEHHIIHDGWSFHVLLGELLELYKVFSAGNPSPLADLSVQFADFATWQRRWMEGDEARAQLTYWKQKLSGSPSALNWQPDHPRPALQSFSGATPRVELPLPLCEILRALCRREGVTLFMAMLAGFLVVLYRYTGQDDICVGTGIANRRWRETESMLGMILNNVVLRSDLVANPTFRELLSRVRGTTLEAYAHQDIPFDQVVQSLGITRDLSRNPLFQIMFSFHDSPLKDLDFPQLTTQLVAPLVNGSAKFDLNVIVIPRSEQRVGQNSKEGSNGITLVWEYNTDLFDAETMTRMLSHYQNVLEAVVINPEQRLADFPLITVAERQQLLVEWNDTRTTYPNDQSIIDIFEEQVQLAPEKIAVMFEGQELTYSQLNSKANQLAHYLQSLDVGAEILVGLCLERSLDMIVALLAILKAGGAYVPLDPSYPQERLAFMLEDGNLTVLITQTCVLKNLPQHNAKLVLLDTITTNDYPASNLNIPVNAANLAYVIYTSGSTGIPKGVAIPQRGVVRLVRNTNYADFGSDQVFLQLASISFDAATFEIWGALLNGGTLVVLPPCSPSLKELAYAITQYRITSLWLTASLFHLMVDNHLDELTQLRQLLAGGDVLSVVHVQKFLNAATECRLINGYGPTENTTFTCCYAIPHDTQVISSVPIGLPIANTEVYILDSMLNPVPIGIVGELHTGGDGLARGYLNRPELTAEKFIANPFSNDPDLRLYKTGDRVRYLSDGNIEFLGRIDNQVKIRGFRIELGEIEAVLVKHPNVHEAIVITREDAPGDKGLIAYIVAKDDAPSLTDLRTFIQSKLPDYMVPADFVLLDELPLSPNGKVDRKALPALDRSHPEREVSFIAPRDPIEQVLADIWKDVLNLEQAGVHDNFFDLGGHSLLATQVISRIRIAFQIELPLRALFENPTIAALAKVIFVHLIEHTQPEQVGGILNEFSDAEIDTMLTDLENRAD